MTGTAVLLRGFSILVLGQVMMCGCADVRMCGGEYSLEIGSAASGTVC